MSVRPSMIFAVLPAVVQNRIPTIPSIRRSISGIRERGFYSKTDSLVELSVLETPPPEYTSTVESGSATPSRHSIVSEETEYAYSDDVPESSSGPMGMVTPMSSNYEQKTGIRWKHASSGITLMSQAYRESITPAIAADETCASLTRSLYLHGLTYLMRGLPAHLTPEESSSLQAAIPPSIINSYATPCTHALISMPSHTQSSQEASPQDATMLHRVTAILVFQTLMFIQFLLPYIKLFFGHAYRLEREHKIMQRIMSTSVNTADELTRRGLRLSQTICRMNDGKVGQTVNEVVIWWVRGVTGGLQQGIEEGWGVVGEGRQGDAQRREEVRR
ncbi:hypothetical protein P153DRAFT_288721 [Dothidotthia symphoricarpi CBS 119687]|uniref:Uncharacterized protein n=1 Tax=Dothidotthia symphoricarpi CBS 119687 TaxID=1392245 RepID=A0A6A6AEP0_9PLEO|nr:uncharacterized protein P153DRAFT_288721 [Dothidotthia symphoricarpi CBS 119687]KAF2130359.1 hypothetical protein P153DRAFT_288721 [Dothidotthia symphoricarpi CBS 119687]